MNIIKLFSKFFIKSKEVLARVCFDHPRELQLQVFADSDWGSCLDTRHSNSGYGIFLGSSLVAWRSKKQDIVSKSTAEAEYQSIAASVDELFWLTKFLKELHISLTKSTLMLCNNIAAILIAHNPIINEHTKQIEMDCHRVREKLVAGLFKLFHVCIDLPIDGIFTKHLHPAPFHRLVGKMSLLNIFVSS